MKMSSDNQTILYIKKTTLIFVIFSALTSNINGLKFSSQPSRNDSKPCGYLEVYGPHGLIESPGYPVSLPASIQCVWSIIAKQGEIVTISFVDFDIKANVESSTGCAHPPCMKANDDTSTGCIQPPCCTSNYLSVFGVQTTEHCISGEVVPPPLIYPMRTFIKLHTSDAANSRGFKLAYVVGPLIQDVCFQDEFLCNNGRCILKSWHCNGWDECGDSSDERNCMNSNLCIHPKSESCGKYELGCFDPILDRCDGIWDCLSGNDELGCGNCPADQYRCSMDDNTCYEYKQKCDGKRHCSDFSDEIHCGNCEGNKTKCKYSNDCFEPAWQQCDGQFDCDNGEDEISCDLQCPDQITCADTKGCYFTNQHCNGLEDCSDGSDEMQCTAQNCNSDMGGFLCNNGQCIRDSLHCDETIDCKDNSDESGCIRNSVITAAIMGSLLCGLLLVVAISCTCKLYYLHVMEREATRFPAMLHMDDEFSQREPPPPYSAVAPDYSGTSRYFEQVYSCRPQAQRTRRIRRSHRSRPSILPSGTTNSEPLEDDLLLCIPQTSSITESETNVTVPKQEVGEPCCAINASALKEDDCDTDELLLG